MKIVCDSCGAKYSIADEKVAGKVFKIRCKKCSAVIVVRGDQLPAAQDESTAVYDYQDGGGPSDGIWHVVVDGDQQGPFTPAQIGDMLTAGTIDWEAYVWREGFDNWLAARDVPDLVEAVTGQPQDQAAAAAGGGGYAQQGGGADPYAATADAGGGLFAGGDSAFSGGNGGFGGASQGADLFAQHDAAASPFEGGGGDDDVVASTPAPRTASADQAMTGQRNENSVLFSLANLQALATGSPGGGPAMPAAASPAAARPGHASGEGSGLIDIRALAGTTGGGGPAPAFGAPAKKESVDDLLSIGTGPALGGGLGAPILAPVQEERSNKGLLIGVAAAAGVIAIAAVAVIVVLVTKEPEPVAQASGAPAATGTGAIAPGVGTEASPQPTGTTPTDGTNGTTATPTGTEAATQEATHEDDHEEHASSGSSSHRPHPRGSGSSSSGSSSSGSSNTPDPPATMRSSGGGDIDDLLDRALGDSMAPSRMTQASSSAASANSNLPDTPARDEVARALRSVTGPVAACGNGQHGVANTTITVAGSSGRVSSAQVTGQFAGTPVGSCVARAVRGAQFPRFRRASFQVSFPYRI